MEYLDWLRIFFVADFVFCDRKPFNITNRLQAMPAYRYLADAVVVLHVAYVLAVVLGLLATLAGYLFHWDWVRNFWLRGVHLAMIMVVVVHALLGAT